MRIGKTTIQLSSEIARELRICKEANNFYDLESVIIWLCSENEGLIPEYNTVKGMRKLILDVNRRK